MRDFFYTEMKKQMEEIRRIRSEDASEISTDGDAMLIDTVDKILELSEMARNRGLLELERCISEIEGFPGRKYLKSMFAFILDGVDPELLEEMLLARYISSDLRNYRALQYIIMVRGVSGIQSGLHPRVLAEMLLYMLPEETAEEYKRKLPYFQGEAVMKQNKRHLTFGDVRTYVSHTDRISICMAKTLAYENYRCIDEVPDKYNALYLHGFGMIDSEASGKGISPGDPIRWMQHLEILLSDEPKQ